MGPVPAKHSFRRSAASPTRPGNRLSGPASSHRWGGKPGPISQPPNRQRKGNQMINTFTGEARMLTHDELISPPEPGPDEVLVHGTEEDIKRLSKAIKALDADEKRKAKRKAQRAARKANR